MTALLDDFTRFRRGVGRIDAEVQQMKGAIRHLSAELKRDFKVKSLDDARRLVERTRKKVAKLVKLHLAERRRYESQLRKAAKSCPPRLRAAIEELLRGSALSTSSPVPPSAASGVGSAGRGNDSAPPKKPKPTSKRSRKPSSSRSTPESPPW